MRRHKSSDSKPAEPLMIQTPVTGRFAPSPTGALHFGSLVSAVGSYLEAKTTNGSWLLRIEDIDPPREVAGSATQIINDLKRMGLVPDKPVLFQSTRLSAYQRTVAQLLAQGRAYHCGCTRKDLPTSGIYPGTCRNGIAKGKKPRSIRFRLDESTCDFTDKLQGFQSDTPAGSSGDFIIQRADGLIAYQLAVAVDDEFQGVTQVVRGADLLDSTTRQIGLQKALGFTTPAYMHLPIAMSADGNKLSKRTHTDPIKHQDPAIAVNLALRFLGQNPPGQLSLDNLWRWAREHWNSDLIPRQKAICHQAI